MSEQGHKRPLSDEQTIRERAQMILDQPQAENDHWTNRWLEQFARDVIAALDSTAPEKRLRECDEAREALRLALLDYEECATARDIARERAEQAEQALRNAVRYQNSSASGS
jgi:hypothetical protein